MSNDRFQEELCPSMRFYDLPYLFFCFLNISSVFPSFPQVTLVFPSDFISTLLIYWTPKNHVTLPLTKINQHNLHVSTTLMGKWTLENLRPCHQFMNDLMRSSILTLRLYRKVDLNTTVHWNNYCKFTQ